MKQPANGFLTAPSPKTVLIQNGFPDGPLTRNSEWERFQRAVGAAGVETTIICWFSGMTSNQVIICSKKYKNKAHVVPGKPSWHIIYNRKIFHGLHNYFITEKTLQRAERRQGEGGNKGVHRVKVPSLLLLCGNV